MNDLRAAVERLAGDRYVGIAHTEVALTPNAWEAILDLVEAGEDVYDPMHPAQMKYESARDRILKLAGDTDD